MRQKRVAWLAALCYNKNITICFRGVLAQLARALRWHRRGHEFESHILHHFLWTRDERDVSLFCYNIYYKYIILQGMVGIISSHT